MSTAPAETADRPYTRARTRAYEDLSESIPFIGVLADLDPSELRAVARGVRRAARRNHWRRLVAQRNGLLALALRELEAALGDRFAGRRKQDGTWHVFALDCDGSEREIAQLGPTRLRTWAEASLPVTMRVLQPQLLDMDCLRSWHERVEGSFGRRRRERQSRR